MQGDFFKDLKIVELASVLAGPAVGLFFAELGAQVIKVENKTTGGDVTRKWRLPSEPADTPYSAYYCSVNWNKEVLMVDLGEQEGRTAVLKHIAESDIVISNFKKKSAIKMGMDYPSLKKHKPDLIYGQINAYGEDDPTPAFDVVLQAEAGFMYMNGPVDGPSVKMPVALIDLLAAHQLKEGLLLALIRRMKTGKGCYVSTSLLESAIASLANQATNWLMGGHIPQKMGARHPNISPYGDLFSSSDGLSIILAVGTDRQFLHLCQCIDLPGLAKEKRFATNANRVKNRNALTAILGKAIGLFEGEQLLAELKEKGVPSGRIRNMQEVFDQPTIQKMLLKGGMPDGSKALRVKTVSFKLME